MTYELCARIEEASLNAWQPLEQILYDGWLLRFANNYTKRINSVNMPYAYASRLGLAEKVDVCERIYAARNQPCRFRFTSFAAPRGLEELLEVRGYTVLDPTLVMWRELRMANGEGTNSFREQSLDDWFAHHARLSGIAPEKLATHRAILERIHLPRLFATIQTPPSPSPYEGEGRGEVSPYHGEEGGTVACGLDVLDRECFGLFELVTDTAQRGKGFGTQLATEMLKWAQARGARRAFLQVTEANVTARRLYEKVGFRELYRYWYRVK